MGQMGKRIIAISGTKKSGEEILAGIKENLGEKCSCCILITCTEPAKNGKMEVEMHFDGDEALASLLIDHASQVFEERSFISESK
jgi:hypothetical protein